MLPAVQVGPLERRLLWTAMDAARQRSLDLRLRGGTGGLDMRSLGSGHASLADGHLEGSPDWVAEFRYNYVFLRYPRSPWCSSSLTEGLEQQADTLWPSLHHNTRLVKFKDDV